MDFNPDLKNIKWIKGIYDLPEAFIRIKTPGVTSIINEMLPNPEIDEWIEEVGKEQADKITKSANDRGTSMHCFLENFLIEIKKTNDPSAALKYTQIQSPIVLNENKIPENKIKEGRNLFYNLYDSEYLTDIDKLIETETNIYSPFLFYRGKIDWVFLKKQWGIGIRDFKTSSKPIERGSRKEEGYKYQLGAYAKALEDMYIAQNKEINVKYASILCAQTKSKLIQNIECIGEELNEYKKKFETIAKEWHIKNGQSFLIK